MLSFVSKKYFLCLVVLVIAVTVLAAENIATFEKSIPDADEQEFIFLRKKRSAPVINSSQITTVAPIQGVTTSDPIESDSLENENMFLELNEDILLSREKRQVEGCGEEPVVSSSLTLTEPFTTSLSSRTAEDASTFDANLESAVLNKCKNTVLGLTSATVKEADSNNGKINLDLGFTSAVSRKETAECLYGIQQEESFTVGTRTYDVSSDIFISNAANQNVGVVCYLCEATETCLPNAFTGSFYCGTTEMFPYCASGDLSLPRGDDITSQVIQFPGGVPFQDQIHYYGRVYVDGFMSFGEAMYIGDAQPFQATTNAYLLAPFWTDIDTTNSGNVCYQLYDKTESNPVPLGTQKVLKRASDEVRHFSNNPKFEATTVLISTWNQVLQLGSTDTTKKVTFQSVLISDGFKSFAMMFYRDFSWDFVPNLDIIIGYGSSTNSYSNPASGSQAAFTMHSAGSNTGHKGIWFYEIGQAPFNINPAQSCLNWFQQELASLTEITLRNNEVSPCPCYLNKWVLNKVSDTNFNGRNCYFRNNNLKYGGYTRICCYDTLYNNLDIALLSSGGLVRYNERIFPELHEIYDRIPYDQCCRKSNLCQKYFQVRPSRICSTRGRFRIGFGFGDPHISTLDGREYVFNGLGEYIYLLIEKIDFNLQIRTLKALRNNNQETSATIFAGFTLKEGADTRFQVEMDSNRTTLVIYGMGADITQQFYADSNFKYVIENKLTISRNGNDAVEVTLNSGISLEITLIEKALKSSISVPIEFKSVTKGLLGNFDDDKTNDLISRTGSVIADSSTNKQIFEVAKTWAISESESLFIYRDGLSYKDFNFPNFVPFFLEDATDAEKTTAAQQCGSTSASACIYDFLATGNVNFAQTTKQLATERNVEIVTLNNHSPKLTSSAKIFKVTLNVESTLTVTGTDEDASDTVTVSVTEKPSAGFESSITGSQLTLKWTPASNDPVNITIDARDSKNAPAPTLKVEIFLCTGCSNHGNCSETIARGNPGQVASDTFSLAKCTCERGYTGDDCEQPVNFCSLQPCDVLQTCTNDNSAVLGYTCSACPTGYNTTDNKCIDIDECEADPNICGTSATCMNTVGSYKCNCKTGYRPSGSQCIDVNECHTRTHDCSQTCNNTEGSFTCGCYSGFTLAADGKTCDGSVNCTLSCQFTCETDKCVCPPGKQLKADNTSCEDVDECSLNIICDHTCKNSDPGFNCSCLDGYKLGDDKISCTECGLNKWGPNCDNTCNCRGRGKCDNIKGCQCSPEWSGVDCSDDVNECIIDPNRCGSGKTCVNLPGTFECRCPTGFVLNGTLCVDINECSDPNINTCNQTCINTEGSYYCGCNPGYIMKNGVCEDIDECSSGNTRCEQTCNNVVGSYNCFCNYGFQLNTDRKTCLKLENIDPCSEFPSQGCEYACRKNGQSPECYCPKGRYLAADGKSCLDVDECSGQNSCSDTCENTEGSYNCSCPIGKSLADDERTCMDCPDDKWGENCANECNCSPLGASGCNKTTGCICKTGWSGNTCTDDLNECSDPDACSLPLTECLNNPGSFSCLCKSGYQFSANRTQCEDIDECSQTENRVCDQTCTNTDGSFTCSCSTGFVLNGTRQCDDIDECSGSNVCEQQCVNNAGSYLCSCFDGFELSSDRQSCQAILECASGNNCSQTCSKINNVDTCSCKSGYQLAADNVTCDDINECNGTNPCKNGVCVNNDGGYTCNCTAGYKQLSDNVTCEECAEGTYGNNCALSCTCDTTNSLSCNKVDGGCSCKEGWKGNNCTSDEDECTANTTICSHIANSSCKNTVGSFICECAVGFYSSGGVCKECDDTHYGKECASTCSCIVGNTASCNKQTGECTCNTGWQGSNCETDKNECDTANICSPLPICNNTVGSYECNCNSGYSKVGSTCQNINECLIPGQNTCTNLGQQCKDIDGSFICECKSGFTQSGNTCQDINECSTNNGGCEETCNNFDGSFNCSCPGGQTLNSQDEKSCYVASDSTALETTIILDIKDKNAIVQDSSSYQHKKLKDDIAKAVYSYLDDKTSSAVLDVIPNTITLGSVISSLNILVNSSNPDTLPIVSKALYDLLQGGSLTVDGVVTPVLPPLNTSSTSFSKDSKKCDILAVLQPCEKNTVCDENGDGVPKCRDVVNDGPTEDMIIGLSVGIPVFFILCIIIAVIVYMCIKRRNRVQRRPQEHYGRSPFQTIFASNIPKRSGLGANRYGLYSPDTMSQASIVSESSSSEGRRTKRKVSRLDYRYPAIGHENPSFIERPAANVDLAPANFSWDFMFRSLEPMHNFEIQRPKVEKRAFHPLKHSRA